MIFPMILRPVRFIWSYPKNYLCLDVLGELSSSRKFRCIFFFSSENVCDLYGSGRKFDERCFLYHGWENEAYTCTAPDSLLNGTTYIRRLAKGTFAKRIIGETSGHRSSDFSRQYFLLPTVISQKNVVGCSWGYLLNIWFPSYDILHSSSDSPISPAVHKWIQKRVDVNNSRYIRVSNLYCCRVAINSCDNYCYKMRYMEYHRKTVNINYRHGRSSTFEDIHSV